MKQEEIKQVLDNLEWIQSHTSTKRKESEEFSRKIESCKEILIKESRSNYIGELKIDWLRDDVYQVVDSCGTVVHEGSIDSCGKYISEWDKD